MKRRELLFGFSIMGLIVLSVALLTPWNNLSNGHLGLIMLALVVVAIMLGFPTAFTLMGMGVMFAYFAYHSQGQSVQGAMSQTLNLMVQRAYAVMTNDVLISIPLFVFMGYLVERANLIEKLFKSLHLALARVPGSLAVATLVTCAVFATATGIVGAVVTLMGLLAFPAMLRAGYDIRMSAGAITAGGCLGILIPPSVMLIVYGATAGVSVVQLYAGAFFPGLMLAGLYIVYVIVLAKLRPHLAPPLPEAERHVPLPPAVERIQAVRGSNALTGLIAAATGKVDANSHKGYLRRQLALALAPLIVVTLIMGLVWNAVTKTDAVSTAPGPQEMGGAISLSAPSASTVGGVQEPPQALGVQEPPAAAGVQEPPRALGVQEPLSASSASSAQEPPNATKATPAATPPKPAAAQEAAATVRTATPAWFWITGGVMLAILAVFYALLTFTRFEVYKMLLASFFPLAFMILAVLGTIVFGLATPTEAAAVGSFGGYALAAVYMLIAKPREQVARILRMWVPLWLVFGIAVVWFILYKAEVLDVGPTKVVTMISVIALGMWALIAAFQVQLIPTVRESVYLTAKTSAMVCWLFVGSSIFSAAFALLGGQEIVEKWVLSLGLTPVQFMLLSQVIIFLLGWPLEWTEIIVIFMPIFIPLLDKFGVNPLFFGLLVALNLQTAFLSPPVAMAAFYLKGVAPPHVTLNQIFAGMIPFMVIQLIALALLYIFPGIGLWLPETLYKN